MNPRIVCAANKFEGDNTIILGIRHWDALMNSALSNIEIVNEECWNSGHKYESTSLWTQGFVDQFGKFYDRQEAWKIAEQNGQIIRRVGGDTSNGGTLYSENLY